MTMTRWVRAEWHERPGQFALITVLVTLLTTTGAHLVAGGLVPAGEGLLFLGVGLAMLGLCVLRFVGGLGRLIAFLGAGQVLGHVAFTLGTADLGPTSTSPAGRLARGAPPCSLHDLSSLTFPGPTTAATSLSPMVAAHVLGMLLAVLGVRSLTTFTRRARAWVAASSRRLRTRVLTSIRHRAGVDHDAPVLRGVRHLVTPQRGPPLPA